MISTVREPKEPESYLSFISSVFFTDTSRDDDPEKYHIGMLSVWDVDMDDCLHMELEHLSVGEDTYPEVSSDSEAVVFYTEIPDVSQYHFALRQLRNLISNPEDCEHELTKFGYELELEDHVILDSIYISISQRSKHLPRIVESDSTFFTPTIKTVMYFLDDDDMDSSMVSWHLDIPAVDALLAYLERQYPDIIKQGERSHE